MARYEIGQMSKFVRSCKDRQLAVAKKSIERLAVQCNLPREKGGRMPVITSALRGSFRSSAAGQTVTADPEMVAFLAVQGMVAGDKLQFEWSIEYARRVNSGFIGEDVLGRTFNQTGAKFVEFGVDQWQDIVTKECIAIRKALT